MSESQLEEPKDSYIRLENLVRQFQEGSRRRDVLRGLSAAFAQGEFVAILGKSGSGKSTLLNLISGIDRPDQGSIWISGHNLTEMSERERTLFRRHHIGFIFQFFNLIPTLTVWENITLPLELSGGLTTDGRGRAEDLLKSVGMLERRTSYPDRLSGGEQQRVALARALVNDPLLVLADEPTGNLDAETGERVMELLDNLTRRSGRNLVLVTHSRSAAAYADRSLRLRNGRLSE